MGDKERKVIRTRTRTDRSRKFKNKLIRTILTR